MKTRNIAAILAGGSGIRLGGNTPKQLLPLAGRLVIERSIDAFDQNEGIDEVVVVSHPEHIDAIRNLVAHNHWRKVTQVVPGGKERYLSSLAAIEACGAYGNDVHLLIHDAARPLVSQRIINDVLQALEKYEAVGVAIPATDTIWQAAEQQAAQQQPQIQSIPNRATLFYAQTPQAFHLNTIRTAYEKAMERPLQEATDDCGVVMRHLPDVNIHIVAGDTTNFKITYPEDISRAELLLKSNEISANENNNLT